MTTDTQSASNKERLLSHLRALGAAARAVELSPHAVLRKEGVLASPDAIAHLHAELAVLEEGGEVLLGEPTSTGIMAMLPNAGEKPLQLTAARLVALYGSMSQQERAILERWEGLHLGEDTGSTINWPGWAIIHRRRYTSL